MSTGRKCTQCGTPLASDAPEGFCPTCTLEGALLLGSPDSPKMADRVESAKGRFGDFELLDEIARGGMGVVYRARQVSLNRIVAVKLILFGQLSDDTALRRFRAEANAAAKLHHPNIVGIHEVGEQGGQHFFSMDYVGGKNLADFMREQPISARHAARLLKTIAEAIHYAHGQGIIHRDLKPSNILIDGAFEPRITDFGLAKDLSLDSDLTLTGQVLGSPHYIAPEQCGSLTPSLSHSMGEVARRAGEGSEENVSTENAKSQIVNRKSQISASSDIYSLGAILYHLLTGRPPFAAETLTQTLLQVANNEPIAPH